MPKQDNKPLPPMPEPEIIPDDFGVTYVWEEYGLRAVAENIYQNKTGDISTELELWHKNGKGDILLQNDRINILSASSKDTLERRLRNYNPEINWSSLILQLSYYIKQHHRTSESTVEVGHEKPNMKLKYLISPLVQKNQVTVIYGPGGTSKTNLAIYLALLAKTGQSGLSGKLQTRESGKVLYLDFETNRDSFSRKLWAIQDGLGLSERDRVYYRRCYRSLIDEIIEIQYFCIQNQIDFIIIDSMNASLGDDANQAEAIYKYYNALRALGCTVLILDHVTKEGMRTASPTGTAFGSVVKYNACRSQWAIMKKQVAGDMTIQLALKHEKMNDGPLSKPIAMEVVFENDPDDAELLQRISFNHVDYKDTDFATDNSGSQFERVFYFLQQNPGCTITEIAEETELEDRQVNTILTGYHKNKFQKLPGTKPYKWGIAYNDN